MVTRTGIEPMLKGVRGLCLNRLTNGPYKKVGGYLFSQAVSS